MRAPRPAPGVLAVALVTLACPITAGAQTLAVRVSDLDGRPLAGVALQIVGGREAERSNAVGMTELPLPEGGAGGVWLPLAIAGAAAADDYAWVAPWDRYVRVPATGPGATAPVEVVLGERGAPALLEQPRVLVERIAAAAVEAVADDETLDGAVAIAVEDVATAYGLYAYQIDPAIRAWGDPATDPYDRGLAALYRLDAAAATDALATAVAEVESPDGGVDLAALVARLRALGYALSAAGRHDEAAGVFARAVERRDTDPRLLLVWARALARAGRPDEAEPVFRRALAAAETTTGPDEAIHGRVAAGFARFQQSQGQPALAGPLWERAVRIGERALGPRHATHGGWLHGLAGLHHAQRRYADALPLYERAVVIAESWLGPDHPTVAVRLNGLAVTLEALGRLPEAERHLTRALAITEAALGPSDPTVGIRLNNLALNYQAQGRYDEADRMLARALALLETALGPTHSNVAAVLQNYSMLLRAMGRAEEGAELERRAQAAIRGRR